MEPTNFLPHMAGGSPSGEGIQPLPVSLEGVRTAAFAAEGDVERAIRDTVTAFRETAADAERRSDDGVGTLYVELNNTAVKRAKQAIRGTDTTYQVARDAAARAEADTHAGYNLLGGVPYLMTEEAAGVNNAQAWESEAVYRLIGPGIEQQEQIANGAPDPFADPTPPTRPDLPSLTVPPSPPPCPPGEIPYLGEDENGNVVQRCGQSPQLPVPPADEPTPEPFPPDNSQCCPPQQIIVKAPDVHVHIGDGYKPTTPSEPTPSEPTPPKDTPKVPERQMPPAGGGMKDVLGVGPFDGPGVCTSANGAVRVLSEQSDNGIGDASKAMGEQVVKSWESIPLVGPAIAGAMRLGVGFLWVLGGTLRRFVEPAGIREPGVMSADIAVSSLAGFLNRWFGIDVAYYLQPSKQAAQYGNPLNVIGQSDADSAFLAGEISREQWECYTRLNGNQPWQHERAMVAKRARLGPDELVQLYKRGEITRPELRTKLRENGFLDSWDADGLIRLTESIPTVSDLFTWLKKDVWDDKFSADYGLDEDFPANPPAEWKRWIEANGLSMEQVKYEYRAGWELPPKTELYEFVRRLRPGRVPKNLEFTEADALRLLKLNEVPAGIRSRVLAVSFQPVALTYLIEAFKAGTMSAAELVERLQDIGYSQADSAFLRDMIVAKANGQMQGSMGAWTRRTIVRNYVEGSISRDRADVLLSRTVLDVKARADALDDADAIRSAAARRACIKGIRRRYFTGEYERQDARAQLLGGGVDVLTADTLLTGWQCERESRSKEPTVKMLKEWATLGIIDVSEFRRRLLNLGYTSADADRIVVAADASERKRQQAEADAAARRRAADARRAEADARRKRKG